MELYVQIIFILAIFKYCLKAALTGSIKTIVSYTFFAAIMGLVFYPYVIEQPITIVEQLLMNKALVTNGAVYTTFESIAGIFISISLLDHFMKPKKKNRFTLLFAKVFPGLLSLFAILYFELLFFGQRAGESFLSTALFFSLIVFVLFSLIAFFFYQFLKEESMKLELKMILNLAILIIGLLLNAQIADYNLSYAEPVIDYWAMGVMFLITILFFFLGILFFKYKYILKSLIKK